MSRATLYHIPICPFSQRIEILLALMGLEDTIDFEVVDITEPRPQWLLELTRGTTAMPVLTTTEGKVIKESLVILRYIQELCDSSAVSRANAYERAVENMLIAKASAFTTAGYRFVLNLDLQRRGEFETKMLARYAELDEFLTHHNPKGPFLFERFGLAELVFTPMFQRFAFLDYYEDFELPEDGPYARVRAWRSACMDHPKARQVSREAIVKLYYDYSRGAGNGALPEGRTRSSFAFEPHWRERPWPPRGKYGASATDVQLGLVHATSTL